MEDPLRPPPLVEELRHVTGEVLDHRQVAQRCDGQGMAFSNLSNVCAASPPRLSVDHHCAGTAHADPASETVGQLRLEIVLDPSDDIENGLALLGRYGVRTIPPARSIALPNGDVQGFLGMLQRWLPHPTFPIWLVDDVR